MEVCSTDSEVRMRIVEPPESPWAKTAVLGLLMSREEALAHHLKDKMFEVAEHIVRHDPTIADHLGSQTSQ
jgi:hypothetical protein